MFPVHDHFSLIFSRYLAGTLQPNNLSHNVVTSPSVIRDMKIALQSQFLYHYAIKRCSSHSNFGTTGKSLHTETVSESISPLTHSSVLQTALPQIAVKEVNVHRSTGIHFPNSVHHPFVVPFIPIVRG